MIENLKIILILIHGILFQYTVSCCSKEREKRNDIIIIIIFFVINYYSMKIIQYKSILNILWHFILMIIIYYLYNKDREIRIVNCAIFYTFNYIIVIIFINISNFRINLSNYNGEKNLIIVKLYFIVYIFLSLIYSLTIKKICNYFNKNKKVNFIIINSLLIEYISAISNVKFFEENPFNFDISLLIGQMFILITCFYYFILYIKSKKVFQVNKFLELKNLELKIIKDKHAEVIAYLQKIYSLNHTEQVGKILKEIINGNDDVIFEENIDKDIDNKGSLINIITQNAIDKGIQVNCYNEFDISFIEINELELYRVITNIVNNAIRVLKNIKNPTINIRIYEINMKAYVEIENNGPIIEEKNIKKIFDNGFTTNENSNKSHGYGLGIVKELIENNYGTIEVISTELKTIFKIILPIKFNKA